MTVRPARPAERDVAVALWTALHREHEAQDARYRLADDAVQRWTTDVRDWLRSPRDAVWLGLDGGTPVGLLTAHLYETTPMYAPVSLVYVDDLYVRPASRGRGLASALLGAARAWGTERRATELRAGVLAANGAGRAFWARQGAEDFSVTVTLPLK
ncbi:GNAT family N-acetyltransferase [Rubrivirga sp. S365]|uniref:GNAT family N-acetyltransferase n=1 Tax=Rubrivirga litoralis TaxID=3075598 RepID=A0ABU3BT98_9BACT|nr:MULTISPECIES: GNAT family N-acetyltransferase [unclassified Rubrivirga]MDT0632521.1 GNAT family N-acetyltransferase [Rubrivirga sp. F394]MDT7856986.1 GNAT family N-acetyltransferase [Rubrivirga sp. S365]